MVTMGPPRHFKWTVHAAIGVFNFGTGAGTKRLIATRVVQNILKADVLFDTGTSTSTSGATSASLTETDASFATTKDIANTPVTVGWPDTVVITPTLFTNDTYQFVITVEEAEE